MGALAASSPCCRCSRCWPLLETRQLLYSSFLQLELTWAVVLEELDPANHRVKGNQPALDCDVLSMRPLREARRWISVKKKRLLVCKLDAAKSITVRPIIGLLLVHYY